jgi:hypothetical protein
MAMAFPPLPDVVQYLSPMALLAVSDTLPLPVSETTTMKRNKLSRVTGYPPSFMLQLHYVSFLSHGVGH